MRLTVSLLVLSLIPCAHAQMKSVNPTVQKIVDSVSQERITEILKKLDWVGRDLGELSLDTVKMFDADARKAGLHLNVEVHRT